jgi:septin family protein
MKMMMMTVLIKGLFVIGASGTGRTTFVNTLCDDHVLSKKECDNPEDAHNEEGINIKPVSVGKKLNIQQFDLVANLVYVELDEDGVR